MPFDKTINPEALREERRRAIQQSLTSVSLNELNKIGDKHHDDFVGNPCRDEFLRLMAEQPRASFYTAAPQDRVVIYYCREANFGFWVLPDSGMGPLDATCKQLMKEAIEAQLSGRKDGGTK